MKKKNDSQPTNQPNIGMETINDVISKTNEFSGSVDSFVCLLRKCGISSKIHNHTVIFNVECVCMSGFYSIDSKESFFFAFFFYLITKLNHHRLTLIKKTRLNSFWMCVFFMMCIYCWLLIGNKKKEEEEKKQYKIVYTKISLRAITNRLN